MPINETKGESKLGIAQGIVEDLWIDGFRYNLLVGNMYAKVYFREKFKVIGIEGNKLEYNRVPIQEYINNILEGD